MSATAMVETVRADEVRAGQDVMHWGQRRRVLHAGRVEHDACVTGVGPVKAGTPVLWLAGVGDVVYPPARMVDVVRA